jgi:hypothetical protein
LSPTSAEDTPVLQELGHTDNAANSLGAAFALCEIAPPWADRGDDSNYGVEDLLSSCLDCRSHRWLAYFEGSSWVGAAIVLVAVRRIAGVKHPVRGSTGVASASRSRPGMVDIFSFNQ